MNLRQNVKCYSKTFADMINLLHVFQFYCFFMYFYSNQTNLMHISPALHLILEIMLHHPDVQLLKSPLDC